MNACARLESTALILSAKQPLPSVCILKPGNAQMNNRHPKESVSKLTPLTWHLRTRRCCCPAKTCIWTQTADSGGLRENLKFSEVRRNLKRRVLHSNKCAWSSELRSWMYFFDFWNFPLWFLFFVNFPFWSSFVSWMLRGSVFKQYLAKRCDDIFFPE